MTQLDLFPGSLAYAQRQHDQARLAIRLQRQIDHLADELAACQARTRVAAQPTTSKVPALLRQLAAIEQALAEASRP